MNYPTKGGYMMDVKLSFDYMDTQHRYGSCCNLRLGHIKHNHLLWFRCEVCWWVQPGWLRQARMVRGRGGCRGKACWHRISSSPAASLRSGTEGML
jgi:hypothetical protein